jgi:hypothetical protein
MRLAPKLFLPVALGFLFTLAALAFMGLSLFQDLQHHLLRRIALDHATSVRIQMEAATREAAQLASLFLRLPEVEAAYRLALSGNIHDEADPTVQRARMQLRTALAPMLAGYQQTTGTKLKLHFHLPNGRSLVRLWRQTNFERQGKAMDISDDISGYRQTVVHANRTLRPQQGLEVGVGGFDLRSVLPLAAADGSHLGSVEVLVELAPILEELSSKLQTEMAVFMKHDFLPIAIQLQDPQKYPRIGAFVQVRAPKDPVTAAAILPQWLEEALQGEAMLFAGERFLSAYLLRDFSNVPVGVLVLGQDTSFLLGILHHAFLRFLGTALFCLLLIVLISWIVMHRVVLRPLGQLTHLALRIRDGDMDDILTLQAPKN